MKKGSKFDKYMDGRVHVLFRDEFPTLSKIEGIRTSFLLRAKKLGLIGTTKVDREQNIVYVRIKKERV